mgnify:CR=1 FL=1
MKSIKNKYSENRGNSISTSEIILLICVAFSIIFSLYLFFNVNEHLGVFIGLWAPTIMGLINYINLKFKR